MKKIFLLITFFIVGSLFYQCETENIEFVASEEIQPVLLEAEIPNVLVLDPALSGDNIINFSWQDADYSAPTQIDYWLEIDDNQDFTEPIIVASTSQRSISLLVTQLNTAVSDAGLAPFQNGTAYVRIRSTIGSNNVLPQYSNVISFTVFPYTTELPRLYLVGGFQADSGYGTTNTEGPTLASSEFGNETDYEGFAYFGGSDLSFQLHRAGFVGEYVEGNPIYGNDADSVVEGAAGTFVAPSEGYYRVNVDLNAGTISYTETNWGLIGPGSPAGNWDADIDMTYNIEAKVWEFNNASTSSGEFKFRANDDWGINFGGDDNNDGSLDYGGSNFENNTNASRFILDLSKARAYTFSISND